MHTLSPVTDKINVLESAEGEMKVSVRIGYQIRDLWLLSQTLILVICAKFQYSLNVLFCEPSEIHEYKQNFTVFPEFRTMLIFTNGNLKRSLLRPSLLSENPSGVGMRQAANVLYCAQNFIII